VGVAERCRHILDPVGRGHDAHSQDTASTMALNVGLGRIAFDASSGFGRKYPPMSTGFPCAAFSSDTILASFSACCFATFEKRAGSSVSRVCATTDSPQYMAREKWLPRVSSSPTLRDGDLSLSRNLALALWSASANTFALELSEARAM